MICAFHQILFGWSQEGSRIGRGMGHVACRGEKKCVQDFGAENYG